MIWHSSTKENVARELDSQPKKGLTDLNAGVRRAAFGINTMFTTRKRSAFPVFIGKLLSPLSIIMILISSLSLAVNIFNYRYGHAEMSRFRLNLIYAGVLMLCALILDIVRAAREISANSTIVDIKRNALTFVRVRRNGIIKEIMTDDLVPGDIIQIEVGDIIPADGRLLITRSFMCDERVITGDDTPALKDANAVLAEETPVSQRCNMAYAGTVAVTGRAVMMVTDTGSHTELAKKHGKRPALISNRTPLVKNAFSIRAFGVWLVLCTVISVLSVYAVRLDFSRISLGFSDIKKFVTENFEIIPDYLRISTVHSDTGAIFDGIIFFLTLVVCIVPVGLPQNIMRSIAKGIATLRKDGIMLHRFKKTEIIGCTSVICTDKSGTLTQDRLTLLRAWPAGDSPANVSDGFWSDDMKYLMRCCVLCCDRRISFDTDAENEKIAGDPIEEAIITAYVNNGGDIGELLDKYPRCAEIPFDASRKLMTVVYNVDGVYMTVTKGAPEALISICAETDEIEIARQTSAMFKDGLKVIAVAVQSLIQLPEKVTPKTIEHDLSFVGLLGFDDPCREDVGNAIDTCSEAGIRTVMITGDHPETAASLARRLHILGDGESVMTGDELVKIPDKRLKKLIGRYSVFARVTPEDKVRIIKSWQSNGASVLMTAGGMTDAPALHKADISCSVESTATDVAVDAADVTLSGASFSNIASMIRQGRRIRKNLKNLTEFSVTCSLAETLLLIFGGIVFRENMLGLLPLTILNLMLFLIVQPGFAYEHSDKYVMKRMPDQNNGILIGKFESYRIWIAGLYILFNSVIAYMIGSGYFRLDSGGKKAGLTMAFAILGLGLPMHALCSRSELPMISAGIFRNFRLLAGAAATAAVTATMIALPWIARLMGFAALSLREWLAVVALLLIQLAVWEYPKLYVYFKCLHK